MSFATLMFIFPWFSWFVSSLYTLTHSPPATPPSHLLARCLQCLPPFALFSRPSLHLLAISLPSRLPFLANCPTEGCCAPGWQNTFQQAAVGKGVKHSCSGRGREGGGGGLVEPVHLGTGSISQQHFDDLLDAVMCPAVTIQKAQLMKTTSAGDDQTR
jgi:hypothetical protein